MGGNMSKDSTDISLAHTPLREDIIHQVHLALDAHFPDFNDKIDRRLIAIAGPPGAGKSTLVQDLYQSAKAHDRDRIHILPMDGFHLDNHILEERNLLARKGAPQTFDTDSFHQIIARVAANAETVFHPVFDREQDMAIAEAGSIPPGSGTIYIEGNYLLLNEMPWAQYRHYFDMTIFLKPSIEILKKRLLDRWLTLGLNHSEALEKTMKNDMPNGERVITQSGHADIMITIG